jgi:hypothetical protein
MKAEICVCHRRMKSKLVMQILSPLLDDKLTFKRLFGWGQRQEMGNCLANPAIYP